MQTFTSPRRPILEWAMILPAIALSCFLFVLEATDHLNLDTDTASSRTWIESLTQGDVEAGFAHIRAGVNPNASVALRDQALTGGRDVVIAPIAVAAAYGRDDTVKMLMSAGADLTMAGNRQAVCVAARLGHQDIAQIILHDAGLDASAVVCPDGMPSPEAPLLAYVDGTP